MAERKKTTPNERWQKAKARLEKAKMDMRKIEKEMRAEEQKRKRKDMIQFCEQLQKELHLDNLDAEHVNYVMMLIRIGALVQSKIELSDDAISRQQEPVLRFLDEYMKAECFLSDKNGQYDDRYYAMDLGKAYNLFMNKRIRSEADMVRLKNSSQQQLNAQMQNHNNHPNNQ